MQFHVTDRRTICKGLIVRTSYVVVSVRDPGTNRPHIPHGAGLRALLYLAFHDAEPTAIMKLPGRVRPMSPRQAERVWAFVERYRNDAQTVVCHCEQGMSRSPAIAIALAEAFNGDAAAIRRETQPNQYVYELMREAIRAARHAKEALHAKTR